MRTLFLKPHEDRRLRAGHLWIFSNEVDVRRSPLGDFTPGEAAVLRDAGGRPLGTVYVNPSSLITARLISHRVLKNVEEDLKDLFRRRLERALELRRRLLDAPFYRLCHSEGDFLPGLVVDRYDDVLCVQCNTAGMDCRRDTLLSILTELCAPSSIILRHDSPARTLEGLPSAVESVGTPPETVDVPENGAVCTVSLLHGQKTGWFHDQRVNRFEAARLVQRLAQEKNAARPLRVLDAFCYVGGFGVQAARAGADEVTFLDASAPALDLAENNLRRNAPGSAVERVCGDGAEELKKLLDAGRRFDVVFLDPPAFIKRRKDAKQGLTAYARINNLALGCVEDGGFLITSSCSQHLEADQLRRLVATQAGRRGLSVQLLRTGGQGPDHPVHPAMPEGAYLKTLFLRVLH